MVGCALAAGGGVGIEFAGDDADIGIKGVYEEDSDDAKSVVDRVWDCECEAGSIGREGSGGFFGFKFVGFLKPETMLGWSVCDKEDAPAAGDIDIDGGGFGGKEGCKCEVDAEADVEESGLGLDTTDEDGEDPICRSFASIIAILSFGFGLSFIED